MSPPENRATDVAAAVDRILAHSEHLWRTSGVEMARQAVLDAEDLAREANALLPLANALSARMQLDLAAKRVEDACQAAREMVSALRGALGEGARLVADAALDAAAQLGEAGAIEAAEAMHAEAIRVFEASGDAKNLATTWNNLGLLRAKRSAWDLAAEALRKAADGYRALGEPAAPQLLQALANLAEVHHRPGDQDHLAPRRAALEELASVVEQHPDWPVDRDRLRRDLAQAQVLAGDVEAARRTVRSDAWKQAVDNNDGADGQARWLAAQAKVFRELGLDSDAESALREAIGLVAPGTPGLVVVASNLARLLEDRGQIREAKLLLDQAVTAAEGLGDEIEGSVLRNRADLRRSTGDQDGALADIRSALERERRAHGEHSADAAEDQKMLALILSEAGRQKEAMEALAGWTRAEPPRAGGLPLVMDLRDRGFLALGLGKYREAETWLVMAEGEAFKAYGERHPLTAAAATDLSVLALHRGRPLDALNTARRALDVLSMVRPGPHAERARALGCLATAQAQLGQHDEALASAEAMEAVNDALMGQLFAAASDRERTRFASNLRGDFATFLSVWRAAPQTPERTARALGQALRRKGLGVEAFAQERESQSLSATEDRLRAVRRQAAAALLSPVADDGVDWLARIEALEAEAAQGIPEGSFARRLQDVTVEEVARRLPAGSALVEVVRCPIYDYRHAMPDARPPRSDRYLAFVLRAGAPADVGFADLGEASAIDALAATAALGGADMAARHAKSASVYTDQEKALEELARLVWQPVAPLLSGAQTALLAMDGPLSLVPLDAARIEGERRVLDDVCVGYLASGRDVLRFGAAPVATAEACVLGDPDFDMEGASLHDSSVPREAFAALGSFQRLGGAREEAVEVAALLGVAPVLGSEVTKERCFSLRAPSVLHMATHGFVLAKEPGAARGDEESRSPLSGAVRDNPMLRAGLALSGVNAWLAGKPQDPAAGNGILTAEEMASLDLEGTELVVLSACETGTGALDAAEGVYGLRRAVALAGARRVVASAWSVPDTPTRELMASLYQQLRAGAGCAEAARKAKRELRQKYPSVTAWGAFLTFGDPGPLPGRSRQT